MPQRRFPSHLLATLVLIGCSPLFLWRSSSYTNRFVMESVATRMAINASLPSDIKKNDSSTIEIEENRNHNWVNADCLQPLSNPVLGVHDESRIFNVGFPKMGSSSLENIFKRSGYYSRHHHCGRAGYCGACIRQEVMKKRDPLVMCGNFTVWTQMDYHPPSLPIYPQIQYLHELYSVAPNATYILPFRNVSKWVYSLTHWDSHGRAPNFRGRFNSAVIPELNWTRNMGKKDSDYEILFCNHVRNIRKFVVERPSLSLVEIDIEDKITGEYLESIFRRVNASFWGMANVNKKIHL
eukprot:scaffold945_cov170-Amphora_coffeaeformis.AAC.27